MQGPPPPGWKVPTPPTSTSDDTSMDSDTQDTMEGSLAMARNPTQEEQTGPLQTLVDTTSAQLPPSSSLKSPQFYGRPPPGWSGPPPPGWMGSISPSASNVNNTAASNELGAQQLGPPPGWVGPPPAGWTGGPFNVPQMNSKVAGDNTAGGKLSSKIAA
jgi:hypothetical protein